MQGQKVRFVDHLVQPKRIGLVVVRPFDETARISATAARDRLPVAVSGRPLLSIAFRGKAVPLADRLVDRR